MEPVGGSLEETGVFGPEVSEEQPFIDFPPIEVGDDVWIGTRAIILPGRKIGRGAVIGAGAVVTKDVPDYAIIGGNPARVLKYRTGRELANGSTPPITPPTL